MKKIIPVGSLSYAQKARRTLHASGLWVRLIKDEGEMESDGCLYGVEVREEDYTRALMELRLGGIPPHTRRL